MANFKISLKARLILYHKGKIMLLKQTNPNGGNYTLVGGTIEKKEFAKEALIREVFEETGVVIKGKDLSLVHVLQKNENKEQRIILYFKAKKWEGEIGSKEPDKFSHAEWFSLDKLPKNMTGAVKQVLKFYIKGILFSIRQK